MSKGERLANNTVAELADGMESSGYSVYDYGVNDCARYSTRKIVCEVYMTLEDETSESGGIECTSNVSVRYRTPNSKSPSIGFPGEPSCY
jgi:hypothetical protein